ncbi:acyl transferase/acyl hydrolase/lysophospholipase [Gigaspora rosea]|uniref:Acyl transferase/acyl hydrolase/lysophospholipase n=1 Tax=Gigaspora rosea TaxID=44941 RepID=A0A397WCG0_9GLOM|nr:acyl transferase/acyl hydrolase/lysophospholipase [Gigaspora rosea]
MEDTKYIISIDGGGIKGVIPAMILAEIEKRVTEEMKKENPNADFRCADFFDIFAGTSTGSILALALVVPENNRPKYSGPFMVDFFQKHGKEVFPNYSPFRFVDKLLMNITNIFQGVNLSDMANNVVNVVEKESIKIETKVESIFGLTSPLEEKSIQNNEINIETISKVEEGVSKTKSVEVKTSNTEDGTTSKPDNDDNDDKSFMDHFKELEEYLRSFDPFLPKYDPSKFEDLLTEYLNEVKIKDAVNGVGVFITSFNISSAERTFFTNLTSEHEDVLMKDVIRASAAAPTYFPAKNISNKYFIDGGVFMNNPTTRVYLEAKKKFPNSKFIVISLGTGRYLTPLEKYSNAGVAQWVSPLITLLMDSEQLNHHDTMEMLAEFDGSKYYRIQPTLEEELNLADASDEDVKKLIAVGDKVINDSTNQLDEIVSLLVDKCKKKKIIILQ